MSGESPFDWEAGSIANSLGGEFRKMKLEDLFGDIIYLNNDGANSAAICTTNDHRSDNGIADDSIHSTARGTEDRGLAPRPSRSELQRHFS